MDKYDRIFELHRALAGRRTPVSAEDLQARLECSRATLYRIIAFLRDRLGAPIEHDTDRAGFIYAPTPDGRPYELPGLWFSAAELQALVAFRQLLENVDGGLLAEHLRPAAQRIEQLLRDGRLRLDEAPKRIRLLGGVGRQPGPAFDAVAAAVLQRQRLRFAYRGRARDTETRRDVSPQRLAHYRDNWYLDAFDHGRQALRTFAVDRIANPETTGESARDIPDGELDQHLASAFGIFAGKANKEALLRFSAERARWVADERWHPQQTGQYLTDGRYELRVPYREPTELVMEILRHGAEVEVVAPAALREQVRESLEAALGRYGKASA
ncbi:MAG: transcriptional regulator [Gammaproteobacteria bacterium PRO9]|nr:transcriptional regulator [Gammaproteobacteria bacterium PRO9]